MITLTVSVPTPGALITAGYGTLQLQKSSTQMELGPFVAVAGGVLPLDINTLSYTLVDPDGSQGDWYNTVYTGTSGTSRPGNATAGYTSDLIATVRDLLGVSILEANDQQISGFAYLPSALARVRKRLPTFDTIIALGGDRAQLCLGALAHLIAAMLCPRMTTAVMDMEIFKDYRYQRNRQLDWTATAVNLMAIYEILISQAAGETSADTTLYLKPMILAGPSSANIDTSAGLVQLENDLQPQTTQGTGGI